MITQATWCWHTCCCGTISVVLLYFVIRSYALGLANWIKLNITIIDLKPASGLTREMMRNGPKLSRNRSQVNRNRGANSSCILTRSHLLDDCIEQFAWNPSPEHSPSIIVDLRNSHA